MTNLALQERSGIARALRMICFAIAKSKSHMLADDGADDIVNVWRFWDGRKSPPSLLAVHPSQIFSENPSEPQMSIVLLHLGGTTFVASMMLLGERVGSRSSGIKPHLRSPGIASACSSFSFSFCST